MRRHGWAGVALVALGFGLATALSGTVSAQPVGPVVVSVATLPQMRIGAVQNAVLPGSVANDRGMFLGGIGSDLWHGRTDAPDEFWQVTDRGPNGQIRVDNETRRTFPIPDFTPLIIKTRVEGNTLRVVQTIPIVGQSGRPVTGLSNIEGIDEVPYDYSARGRVPYNASGLDTEGLVRTSTGDFWLVDEYSPSILRVDATGRVVKRYIPEGLALTGADYPVAPALPAIYGKRKVNRGFEGLALSADERTLFVVLQSPLANPDRRVGDVSRTTRVLVFDIATERVTAEYAYRHEVSEQFDSEHPKPDEMKLSGVVFVNPTTLLVLERTDWVAKLYLVDMAAATNLLGSRWDDVATAPSLEALPDPAAAGVRALPKTLLLDLSLLPDMPEKIEGVAIIDENTIAVANDNDFGIGDFDAAGNHTGVGAPSRLIQIRLPAPIPGYLKGK